VSDNSVTPDRFYIAGGALSPDSPSYIERPADDELFNGVLGGNFCYVLADHHMGKSSLMFRTAWRLQQQGFHTVEFDLSGINADLDISTAYLILVKRINFELKLSLNPDKWWADHSSLEAGQRFTTFLQEIVLTNIEQPLAIFVDGADRATLNSNFFTNLSTEIQTCYGKRMSEPVFKRLNFVILGMSERDDLVQEINRPLFDTGHKIVLNEFTREQCRTLQQGLQFDDPQQSRSIFDRILYWTGGHPYLTQKLCLTTASMGNRRWSTPQVDALVEQLFTVHSINEDPNLQFIENYIKNSPHQRQLLKFYRHVYNGDTASNGHLEQKELKLIGLINAENGTLRVRNPFYREVFNPAWVKATTPIRWKPYVAIVSILLICIVAGVVVFFIRQQQQRAGEAQVLTENFQSATRADEQIIALAGLLELPGYREQAQQLFLQDLDDQAQLAMFNISDPLAVGEELTTVVAGIYANANLSDEQRYVLLEAMVKALHQLQTSPSSGAIELELEISQWLKGHEFYHTEELYQRAIDAYTVAININNQNPGIYFDRGLAYAALGNPDQALVDFSQTLNLDNSWQARVRDALNNDPTLYSALWTDQGANNTLIALVPTPTDTSTPTSTPTITPTPTLTPTATTIPPTETPTATPTSTSTPIPAVIATRPAQPTNTPTPAVPNGVITLLHPTLTDEPSYGPTQFVWQWVGSLPPQFGFEVRVWQENKTPTGVHNSVLDNQNGNIEYIGDNTYRLKTDITDAVGIKGTGDYLWTVAPVRISPDYEDIRQQAEPIQMRYAAPGPSGGKDDDKGGGGGVGIE